MKEAMLRIRGLVGTAEDGSEIELVSVGEYEYAPGLVRFRYEESELTGLKGTLTEFQVEPRQVLITRTGALNMQMLFLEREKHIFAYETPVGDLTMGVYTYGIFSRFDENGGVLDVRYSMDFGAPMRTKNSYHIEITTEKGQD